MRNTLSIGRINELKVSAQLLQLGYQVFESIVPLSLDLAIRCENNVWIKIQVKTCAKNRLDDRKRMMICSKPRLIMKPYLAEDIDFFIGVYGEYFYIVPYEKAFAQPNLQSYMVEHSDLGRWDLLPPPIGVLVRAETEQDRTGFLSAI